MARLKIMLAMICAFVGFMVTEPLEAKSSKTYTAADIKELRQSAESGEADAEYNLGNAYFLGNGVQQDWVQAVKWYQKAADRGNADAEYSLGKVCAYGYGVQQDWVQAVKWYQKAAVQGNADAEYGLGNAFAYGNGVQKDPTQAVKWYQKAADQGDARAEYSLGNAYAYGNGIQKDPAQAVKWYQKAADQQGSSQQAARDAIARIQSPTSQITTTLATPLPAGSGRSPSTEDSCIELTHDRDENYIRTWLSSNYKDDPCARRSRTMYLIGNEYSDKYNWPEARRWCQAAYNHRYDKVDTSDPAVAYYISHFAKNMEKDQYTANPRSMEGAAYFKSLNLKQQNKILSPSDDVAGSLGCLHNVENRITDQQQMRNFEQSDPSIINDIHDIVVKNNGGGAFFDLQKDPEAIDVTTKHSISHYYYNKNENKFQNNNIDYTKARKWLIITLDEAQTHDYYKYDEKYLSYVKDSISELDALIKEDKSEKAMVANANEKYEKGFHQKKEIGDKICGKFGDVLGYVDEVRGDKVKVILHSTNIGVVMFGVIMPNNQNNVQWVRSDDVSRCD